MTPQETEQVNNERKMTSINSLTINVTLAAVLVIAIVGFALTLSQAWNGVNSRIDKIETSLLSLGVTIKKLSDVVEVKTSSRYTKEDHVRECLKQQILNPSWRCPYAPQVINFDANWQTTARKND